MKVIVFFGFILILVVMVFMFLSSSNPSEADFYNWYAISKESGMRIELEKQIKEELKTKNDIVDFIVNGVYDVALKSKIDKIIEDAIIENRKNITYENRTLFAIYTYLDMNGNRHTVRGYLNNFHEIN